MRCGFALVLSLAACNSAVHSPIGASTNTIVIAHRGFSYSAPEHTFAAYDQAIEAGADYIEQDVQRTSDGVLVVIHDATVDRTLRGDASACSGSVADHTLAQLKSCSAGRWFIETFPARARAEYATLRIPTLLEVLQRYKASSRFYIETKDPDRFPGIEREIVEMLRAEGLLQPVPDIAPRVYIQSFSETSLRRFKSLEASLPLIQLVPRVGSSALRGMLDGIRDYAFGIGPHMDDVDASLVSAVHTRCMVIHPYTAESRADIVSLAELDVDGLFTDRPDIARDLIGSPRNPLPRPDRCTVRANRFELVSKVASK
ncbi:MAG TPA: glycerophosphodiester phosphodiesterase family protein [Gemmatimonadaceae bacterium]